MASIGRADLLIVPKFDGLSSAVNKALGNVDMSASGKSGGTSFANGFKGGLSTLTGGAVMGAVSAVTTKAIDAITSHMSDAVARLDTLKNYPQVMQSLGVSAREADASIGTMSDRLSTLPTRLDVMTSSVQGIYAATKDYGVSLQTATEAGLAMNDLLLAGGQGVEVANVAMEQFRQILAKGKPEMQDWKTLISAAPGQMDQLAKSMLGPTANANDLYEALGGGKNDPTITMNELLEALIRLDKEGGAGLESLQSQAEKATGGIATSMANMENAITRGLADTMDAIGRDRISGFFNSAKEAINGFFGIAKTVVPVVVDIFGNIASTAMSAAPAIAALAAGIAMFSKVGPALSGITTLPMLFTKIGVSGLDAASGLKSVLTSINPLQLGLAAVTATVVYFGTQFAKARMEEEKMASATSTFNAAVARSASLDAYAGGVDGIGVAAKTSSVSIMGLYESMQQHADAMQRNNAEAEANIATLNTIQDVIDEYAGKAAEGVTVENMSAESKGKLNWALKELASQYGLNIDAEQVLNGTYQDEAGNVLSVKDAVDQLCESKRQEARVSALQSNLTEAYAGQREAIEAVRVAQEKYNTAVEAASDMWNSDDNWQYMERYGDYATFMESMTANQSKALDEAEGKLKDYNDAISTLEGEMGMASGKAGELNDMLLRMSDSAGNTLVKQLAAAGVDVSELATKMADAGISTQQLESIGSASMARLASACHGNVDLMVAALVNLDGIDIHDKNFEVSDDGTITFKKGQLTDLDKQKLRDKGFIVTDNGTATVAKRNVDGTSDAINAVPGYKHATVEATVHGESDVWDLVSAIGNVASKTVNIVANTLFGRGETGAFVKGASILSGAVSARGLYERMMALGNVRPLLHADGGIVDSPTLTSVGFVGENGAEAIVPLTNRQYVKPFARVLADEMGGSMTPLIRWLDAHLGEIIAAYAPTATPREMRRMNQKVAAYA